MDLNKGDTVIVHIEDGGVFHAKVDRFERDGAVAVLMPTRDPVRDVFPKGYNLGSAHWESHLTKLTETGLPVEPVVAGSVRDRLANADGTPA